MPYQVAVGRRYGARNAVARVAFLFLTAGAVTAAQANPYILAGGVEADTDGAWAVSALGEREIRERTWLSLLLARNQTDAGRDSSIDTTFAELAADHHFDPVGVRLGAVYWGDNDILDSVDGRLSLYWQNSGARVAADVEYRDFEFELPATRFLPGREFGFDATGYGVSTRFDLSEPVTVSLSGMSYDYSVNLRLDQNRGLLRLLNVSRLGLINSLVDYRVTAGLGVEQGLSQWNFSLSTWRGAVDRSDTVSATLSFLTPLSERSDIEFGLGYDNSDLYDDAVFFSVFLYLYGGS